ncbi:MAG: GntG family PLP-dependent aldolase [Spirochaetia bacterium]|nr:GntG family PLP-dependent aldolase [Spirochaetia bacterium]
MHNSSNKHLKLARNNVIDLRSDTLTMPDDKMLKTILSAKLGDDGRTDEAGRGEDLTVNELEDLAAAMTGKEEAILFSSGTLANTAAILTWCAPGDKVLVDEIQHILLTEKVVFDKSFGQLNPVQYKLNEKNTPSLDSLKELFKQNKISLLCVENTHNFSGGTCLTVDELREINKTARSFKVPVHMDGARIFNASVALGVEVKEICTHVDSLMFCISKGLGAPVGSLLCGSREFIKKARVKRKLLGGNMRQAGIIAAPGIYALKNNIERLKEDHDNARYVSDNLKGMKKINVQKNVESNIVMLDVSKTGITPELFCLKAKEKGLLIRPIIGNNIRLVFYKGISREDAAGAVKIIRDIDSSL